MDEDAFINLRIVDQIFAGHGPVFNVGERVEASTSTLWLVVLVIGRAVFGVFSSMEWIALLGSLVAAVAAFVVAGTATRLLHRGEDGLVVPVGLTLVAAVAVVWDFATSGLEMGLVWLWIAASWYVLVSIARSEKIGGRKRVGFGIIIGLAPLVRPDLTLMMLCFLVAWFMLVRPRRVALDLVAIFALPFAGEVFRMGYYATLVPTTALAKDAGGVYFGQGWRYAKNFVEPYRLWLTAVLIVVTLVARYMSTRDRRLVVITLTMIGAAFAHATYITAIGGDYMHGRLLLPSFFALALPASIAVRRRMAFAVGINVFVAAWAIFTIVQFREPPNPKGYLSPISDWRALSGAKVHPNDTQFGLDGNQAAALYAQGVRGYFKAANADRLPPRDPNAFVLTLGAIGVSGYDAGPRIWIVDIGGLAEPLAARTAAIPGHAAGHRKQISDAWYDARFGASVTSVDDAIARRALTCGPIPGLLRAVDAPLTPARFLSNIWHSFGYTTLKIPDSPEVAEREWCQ